jgi:hypothetical protein
MLIDILAAVVARVLAALVADWRRERLARADELARSAKKIRQDIANARETVRRQPPDERRRRLREHAAARQHGSRKL